MRSGSGSGTALHLEVSDALFDRFWSKVRIGDGCWEWIAALDHGGYGRFQLGSKTDGSYRAHKAHRVSYALSLAPIPAHQVVAHHCDNRRCVRPSHLFIATQTENVRDMVVKGRAHRKPGSSNHQSKLTESQVRRLRSDIRRGRSTVTECARALGVSTSLISQIARGRAWKHVMEGQ